MEVQVKEVKPMNVVAIRHIGPYHEIGSAFERLAKWAGKRGLLGPDSKMLGIYYDDPRETEPDQLRSDACLIVVGTVVTEGEVVGRTVGGGKYAVYTHVGSYERLPDAWNKLDNEWYPQSGETIRNSPCLEIYLNSPEDTPPEKLITELYLSIE